jgi:hypothetical protein
LLRKKLRYELLDAIYLIKALFVVGTMNINTVTVDPAHLIDKNDIEAVKYFLDHVNLDNDQENIVFVKDLLVHAIEKKNQPIVCYLVTKFGHLILNGHHAIKFFIYMACINGFLEILQYVNDFVDKTLITPDCLLRALSHGNLNIVEYFDPESKIMRSHLSEVLLALNSVSNENLLTVIKYLREKQISQDMQNLPRKMLQRGNCDCIKYLVNNGYVLDLENDMDVFMSANFNASSSNENRSQDMIVYLLTNGCRISEKWIIKLFNKALNNFGPVTINCIFNYIGKPDIKINPLSLTVANNTWDSTCMVFNHFTRREQFKCLHLRYIPKPIAQILHPRLTNRNFVKKHNLFRSILKPKSLHMQIILIV